MKNVPLVDLICREVTEWMTDYMTPGVMASEDRARFELHLHACTWCMTYFKQMARTAATARQCLEPEPERAAGGTVEAQLLSRFRDWSAKRVPDIATATSGASVVVALPVEERPAPAADGDAASLGAPVRGRFFKFLDGDARGSISGFEWPTPAAGAPGAWIQTATPLVLCERGVHACGPHQLAHWLDEQLWVVELAGELQHATHAVLASHARLVRRVDAWSSESAARFARAAYDHAQELASADAQFGASVAPHLSTRDYHVPRGNTALAAYCSAMAVARLSGRDHFDQAAYDAERAWQSEWLVRELDLASTLL
jgi:hypothetical protein